MHPCVTIAEVLRAILANVNKDGSLLCMALTCRALLDPSMDALWCDLRHPEPLIRILPEATRGGQAGLTVVNTPKEDEWRRLNALRVRILRYSTALRNGDSRISTPLIKWESIARYYPGRYLLPNLHTFISRFEYVHEWFHLFVGPSLRHLELTYFYWLPTDALIQALPTCSQTLKTAKFRIPKWTEDPETIERFVAVVLSMETLTTLEVGTFVPRPVQQLSALPTLQRLSLAITANQPYSSARLRLPVLKELRIEAPDIADASAVVSFIRYLDVHSLHALTIRAPSQRSAQPASDYMASLASTASSFLELRSFVLEGSLNGLLSVEALSPLFVCKKLACINLFRTSVTLNPRDIETVARAWSDLELLRLGEEGHTSQSTLKIYDLLPLALYCPRLELLGLPVHISITDISSESITNSEWTSTRVKSKLKTLWLRSRDVKCASTEAATFLASVFPDVVLKPASGIYASNVNMFRITAMKAALVKEMSIRPARISIVPNRPQP